MINLGRVSLLNMESNNGGEELLQGLILNIRLKSGHHCKVELEDEDAAEEWVAAVRGFRSKCEQVHFQGFMLPDIDE